MKENIIDKIKENLSEISENNEAYTKLIEFKEKISKTIDQQIKKYSRKRKLLDVLNFLR